MKAIYKSHLILALALLTSNSFAVGGTSVRGGGDNVGLDFQATASRGIQNLNDQILSQNTKDQLFTTLVNSHYLVVDEPLFVSLHAANQDSVATNIPSELTIYINRAKWTQISREEVRQSLAVHELLSLIKLESTGDYHISSMLLNSELNVAKSGVLESKFTVSQMDSKELEAYQQKLFAQMRESTPARTPFSILKELFDTAPDSARLDEFPIYDGKICDNNPSHNYYSVSNQIAATTKVDEIYITQAMPVQVKTKYLVKHGTPEIPEVPSKGPLFPGTPGVPAQPDVFQDGPMALSLSGCGGAAPQLDAKYYQTFQTGTDLVTRSENPDDIMYVRKSGQLIAIKRVLNNISYYSYGWVESEKN